MEGTSPEPPEQLREMGRHTPDTEPGAAPAQGLLPKLASTCVPTEPLTATVYVPVEVEPTATGCGHETQADMRASNGDEDSTYVHTHTWPLLGRGCICGEGSGAKQDTDVPGQKGVEPVLVEYSS